MSPLEARAVEEVEALHRFFVAWFAGRGPDAALDEEARAFAPDFVRIGPNGQEQTAAEVVAMLRALRGGRGPDFAIAIERPATRHLRDDLVVVAYDERQEDIGVRTLRRSSAVFSPDPAAPRGVVWRHLHESWIDPAPGAPPGPASSADPQAAP